jgi:ATP/maltotriose-dependent transcriptional regulator MalT
MNGHLHRARQAFAQRNWREAYEAFGAADEAALDCEDLQCLATAAFLVGHDLEFLRCIERSFRLHLQAGRATQAARDSFWLTITCMFRGETGQANAWLERGRQLLGTLDCAERGFLMLPAIEQALRGGDAAAAHDLAAEAVTVGERHQDADLLAAARHVQARAAIRLGDVPRGLTLLDQTMLAVSRGELSPIMTGMMYCSVIGACSEVCEFARGREWTGAMARWCDEQSGMVAFTDTCLVHRAEIMQFEGAWQQALTEVRRVCERCAQGERRPPGAAFYLQGEVHRLRGDFTAAEQAYRAASEAGFEPQPGLALLRAAQGRTDAAAAAIRRLVGATQARLLRARLLPAHVEIMLIVGDLEEAQRACEELGELCEVLCTDVMRALCAQARGITALKLGDARAALPLLRGAFELWDRLAFPYEAARVRMRIGEACRALGDEEAGLLEEHAARTAFERLGATGELAHLDSFTWRSGCMLSPRELEVLRLIADGQTNKGVANALGLSERTVDRHMSNILTKLGVPSRAAATAYAYSHRLF